MCYMLELQTMAIPPPPHTHTGFLTSSIAWLTFSGSVALSDDLLPSRASLALDGVREWGHVMSVHTSLYTTRPLVKSSEVLPHIQEGTAAKTACRKVSGM